jgi:4-carboxymuconolactone decarboxylase
MRLTTPRISPLSDAELDEVQKERLAKASSTTGPLNIFRTLVRSPDALRAFNWWGGYVLNRNSLSPRDREILILRVGWLCRSGYEWTQHHRIGLQAGLSAEEIERIKLGAADTHWTGAEKALLMAADDLQRDHFITRPVWVELARHYTERQLMDVVFTIAQYVQVSMILNTLGVPLDEGQALDPDFHPC